MKDRFLKAIATISHPSLLPFLALLVIPDVNRFKLEFYLMLFWLIMIQIILTRLYLWYAEREELEDVTKPTVDVRRWTYGKYLIANILFLGLSLYIYPSLILFFLSQLLIMFALYQLAQFKLKWSWHAMGWASLALIFSLLVYLNEVSAIIAGFTILTSFAIGVLRFRQEAHTKLEVLLGYLSGLVLTFLIFAILYFI